MEVMSDNGIMGKCTTPVFGEDELLPDVEDEVVGDSQLGNEYSDAAIDESQEDDGKQSMLEVEVLMTAPIIMPMPAAKRMSLSLQEKVEIIKELEGGEKQAWICKKRRIPKSTVQSIWKNRMKILDASSIVGLGRKRCRRALHENVEAKLVEWIETLRSQNIPVNGPQLRAKAQVLATQLGISDFRSSTGWLDKFKTRHNIVFKKSAQVVLQPENRADSPVKQDRKAALDWITKTWPNLCEGYSPENIFNADEFGLFFNALPDQVSKLMNETCQNGKLSAERVTVMACANSDGSEKRPLLVVGNYNLSGDFSLTSLPVKYVTDSKSWISKSTFESELQRWNEELAKENRNILVVVDASPAHELSAVLSHIKLVTLPMPIAAVLQPLEKGIMQQVKRQYRRLMLDKIIRKTGTLSQQRVGSIGNKGVVLSKLSPTDTNTTVMDAIFMLDCAWTDVTTEDISEGFKSSNLQSINVSSQRGTKSTRGESRASDLNRQKELDASLLLRASKVIQIPPAFTLDDYVLIDSRVHTTDYFNVNYSNRTPTICTSTYTLPNISPQPSRFQMQDHLEALRRWILPLVSESEAHAVHKSISILENFAVKQSHECPETAVVARPQLSTVVSTGPTVTVVSAVPAAPPHQQLSNNLSNSTGLRQMTLNRIIGAPSSHPPSMIIEAPSGVTHCNVSPTGSLGSHNQPTYVSFTLNEAVQNQSIPHNIMDSQPFIAYLS